MTWDFCTTVFIVRKQNKTSVLSTDEFNSEKESVVCMLLNQTEVKAGDCVRVWISNLQKEGAER